MSKKNTPATFWSFVVQEGECLVWAGRHRNAKGYGVYSWGGRLMLAHSVSFMLSGQVLATGLELDHTCRNRACVNVSHLEPVTHFENVRRGLATGETNHSARLTNIAVVECRVAYATGTRMRELAKVYGVSVQTMAKAVRGLTWSHVPGPVPQTKRKRDIAA